MKPGAVPAALVAALPQVSDATWSHLPGLGRGSWLVQRGSAADLVVRQASDVEERAARAAADVAVGPAVVGAAEGWVASQYLSGARVTGPELSRPPFLDDLAALLHRLHACEVVLPDAPMSVARGEYLAAVDPVRIPAGLRAVVGEADRLERSLSEASGDWVPAHLDVVANLLRTGSGLRLIDFEYAAAADPARELGQVIWEAELSEAGAVRLVRAYGGRVGQAPETAMAWAWVSGVTWTAWALSLPDRDGTDTIQRYARRSWERVHTHWARPTL